MQCKKLLFVLPLSAAIISSFNISACSQDKHEFITIKDMLGDETKVKQNPDKVACVSRTTYDLLVSFGLGDKIDGAYTTIYDNPWTKTIYPHSQNEYRYAYNESYETFVARGIDLVYAPEKYISDGLKEHGISSSCVSLYGNPTYDSFVHFFTNMTTQLWTDDTVKVKAKAWDDKVDGAINKVTSELSKHEFTKKKVFYVRGDKNNGIEYTDTKGSFTEFAFRKLGCDCLSSQLTKNRPSKEEILSFKPEIFVIGGIYQNKLVEQLKKDTEYMALNPTIITIPIGLTMFEQLSAMTPIFFYDMANKLYSDWFHYDVSSIIKNSIKEYFNIDLTDEQIQYMQTGKGPDGKDLA